MRTRLEPGQLIKVIVSQDFSQSFVHCLASVFMIRGLRSPTTVCVTTMLCNEVASVTSLTMNTKPKELLCSFQLLRHALHGFLPFRIGRGPSQDPD